LSLENSRVELAEGKRRVRLDLHRAYFSAVLARESLGPLRQILDILREIEEDRRRAVELGFENRVSLLQIRAQIAEIEREIIRAEQAGSSAVEAIELYTDLHPESRALISGFRGEQPGLTEGGLLPWICCAG
jgi:outer membrane protein TolC